MASHLLQHSRERLRAALKPPRQLRPTPAGWVFLLLIFGVGFAALNTGNNLLYLVLSLMLAFLVLSGVLSESALRGIEIRRRLPREIFAEAANPIAIQIRNAQRRVPAFAVVVEDCVDWASPALDCGIEGVRGKRGREPTQVGRVFALRLGPESTETRSYALRPPRRGELRFRSVRVSTRFPFGLFLKSRTIEAAQDTFVYPAIDPVGDHSHAGASSERNEWKAAASQSGAEVIGLRPFVPGDPLRRVHWRRSLRSGQPVVLELSEARNGEVMVHLRTAGAATDANDRGQPRSEDFEAAVSRATSEVVAQLEAQCRVGLTTDFECFTPDTGARQRAQLLRFLSVVERGAPVGRADTESWVGVAS